MEKKIKFNNLASLKNFNNPNNTFLGFIRIDNKKVL